MVVKQTEYLTQLALKTLNLKTYLIVGFASLNPHYQEELHGLRYEP